MTSIVALGLIAGSIGSAGSQAGSRQPNVLFLLADDLRADAIGALGNPAAKTPNLDALVRRGFCFSNAYCQGANTGAVCTPSRNMILSGRSYFRFGRLAEATRPNLPASMNAAGVDTFHFGKRGNTATAIQALFRENHYLPNDEAARRSGEPGKIIADAAVAYLKTRDRKSPFCMYLAFESPHDPRIAADKYRRLHDPARIPLPKNFLPEHPFDNGELRVRDEQLAPWPRTEAEIRRHLHDYYAVVTALDGRIGQVLSELKEQGDLENTIVVFSSDHGLAIGSHGLMGKQSLYDHSMKAPLVFAGPSDRIPSGRISEALVYLFDIYPTLCQLVGAAAPQGIDGVSLQPILQGNATSVRDGVLLAYRDVQRAVRVGDWKLIYYPKIDRTQLFDLRVDPDERDDVSKRPENAATIERLFARLRAESAHFNDPLANKRTGRG